MNDDSGDYPSASTVEVLPACLAEAFVIELQDDEALRRLPLFDDAPVTFGSSRRAQVRVADETVSSLHCELTVKDGWVHVRDLGSRNGTYAGAARIASAICGPGTVLTIGSSTLSVAVFDGSDDDEGPGAPPLPGLAGASPCMRRVAAQVRRLASLSAPVLVCGETGTGKELVARALHSEGRRAAAPFVALNVATMPRELVETELFGHERGAFTGAVARRAGAFEEADGGTLFLDEIGELPLDAQPKLLRALDGYDVRRVGGGKTHRPDARVVAATHVSLGERVEAQAFRRDLFHRLEVFVVRLPALRDRRSDIVPIAKALLRAASAEIGPRTLTSAAAARLTGHDWEGNVRELRNALMRATDIAGPDATRLDVEHVERAMRRGPSPAAMSLTPTLAKALLRSHGNNLSSAARAAGYARTSFRKILGAK